MAKKRLTIPSFLTESIKENGDKLSLGFAGEKPFTYNEMGNAIESVIALLEKNGVVPGDKVAILSSNMPNWGVSYFAVTSMGAVVVPILPDFTVEEVANVLEHSEASGIFVSNSLLSKISGFRSEKLKLIITTDDFTVIEGKEGVYYDSSAAPEMSHEVEEDDIAAIIYTSGTTGKSKGVMLTHKNLCFMVEGCWKIQNIFPGDVFLSILPLSHTYEQSLGLLLGTFNGATTYYLRKAPTPSVLLPALQEIRPTIMLTVPLIMEKIYFGKIVPTFQKNRIIS
ncbi:MAG TPA: AMP-binding protein, partial [Bacteroidales bacterium]|nr:AMP-binding protein [Bacteroidales bacterium]